MTHFYVTTYLPKGLGCSPGISYDPVVADTGEAAISQFTKRKLTSSAAGRVAATVSRPGEISISFYFAPLQSVAKSPVPINFRRGRSFVFRARMRAAGTDDQEVVTTPPAPSGG